MLWYGIIIISQLFLARRRPTISAPGNALYDASVLFSDTDEDENLWSDDEDWERSMREWLAAWAPSLEDRWQPDLFGGNHRSAAADFQPHTKPREGLSKAAINSIKRETYGLTRVSETSRDQEDCPVCLEKFISGQALLSLPCNHRFHPDCLTPWLEGHEQCPYCRAHVEGTVQSEPECGGRDILSIHTDDFVSWLSVVEQGMNRLSHGGSWPTWIRPLMILDLVLQNRQGEFTVLYYEVKTEVAHLFMYLGLSVHSVSWLIYLLYGSSVSPSHWPRLALSFILLSSCCHQFVSSTLSSSASAYCCVHFYPFDVERQPGMLPNRRLIHGAAGARWLAGVMKVNENFLWTKTTLFCLISVGGKFMWPTFIL